MASLLNATRPRSLMLTHLPGPHTTMWSSMATSSRRAASASWRVTTMSSGLGVGSPRRVVVHDYERRSSGNNRGPQHLGHPEVNGVDHPLVDDLLADNPVLRVEQHNAKLLLYELPHLRTDQAC